MSSNDNIIFYLDHEGDYTVAGFPLPINYLLGDQSNYLEIDIGVIPGFFGAKQDGTALRLVGTGTLGYRLQPEDGGFLFRIAFTPFFFKYLQPFFGISLGYAF